MNKKFEKNSVLKQGTTYCYDTYWSGARLSSEFYCQTGVYIRDFISMNSIRDDHMIMDYFIESFIE